jgi:hypothetical protein
MAQEKQGKTTRHSAANKSDCEKMAKKYNWDLRDIELNPKSSVLKYDCIFDGDAEFPKTYGDNNG